MIFRTCDALPALWVHEDLPRLNFGVVLYLLIDQRSPTLEQLPAVSECKDLQVLLRYQGTRSEESSPSLEETVPESPPDDDGPIFSNRVLDTRKAFSSVLGSAVVVALPIVFRISSPRGVF
jgi:hypothetical protein